MNDLVDVILPTHRRPHTLEYSIRSVLAQTHRQLRLHVVGDGCEPDTEAVVRAIDDPRIVWYGLPKAHGYGYENRNTVLRETDGRFVAYISDDDLWFPDHLERALAALGEKPGMVATRACMVQFPDVVDPYFFAFDWRVGLSANYIRHWFMGQANLVHSRSVFDQVGFWNGRLSRFGDREFYNRVRLSPVRCRCVEDMTVLRFLALHWDRHYKSVAGAPQAPYLDRLQNPEWCTAVRQAVQRRGRTLTVRRRQWTDFGRFATVSGLKFVRFHYQRLVHPVQRQAI